MNQKLGKRRKRELRKRLPGPNSQTPVSLNEISHYLPFDRHPEIENDLIRARMAGPILTEQDLADSPSEGILAQAASACIEFAKRAMNVTQDIYIAIVRTNARNALAIGRDNLNCIVISSGYIFDLSILIQNLDRTVSFRELWENPHGPPKPVSIVPTRSRAEAIEFLLTTYSPVDDFPRNVSLMSFCTEFIVFHELGHIINGHTRNGIFRTGSIKEIASLRDPDLLLTVRALELDADAFAVQHTMWWMFLRVGRDGLAKPLVADHQTALISVLTCMMVTIISMDVDRNQIAGEYQYSSHPPAYVRSWGVMAAAAVHLADWQTKVDFISPDWEIIVHNVRIGIEVAISIAGNSGFDTKTHEQWMAIIVEHDTKSLARWAKIRPALELNKFGTHKLAPAQVAPE